MLESCGVTGITRIERSRRYRFTFSIDRDHINEHLLGAITCSLYDRMTECVYHEPLRTFSSSQSPEPVRIIPVMAEGRKALEMESAEKGLGFDDWDLDFYTVAFRDRLKRDPTDVELFDIGKLGDRIVASNYLEFNQCFSHN